MSTIFRVWRRPSAPFPRPKLVIITTMLSGCVRLTMGTGAVSNGNKTGVRWTSYHCRMLWSGDGHHDITHAGPYELGAGEPRPWCCKDHTRSA